MDFGFIDTITICSWATAFIKVLPIVLPVVLLVSLLWKGWRQKVIYTITRKTSLLKVIYFVVSFIIGFALIVLFSLLYAQIISIQCGTSQTEINVQNLALAFLGTVSGLAALFGVYLAIQRTDESKKQTKESKRQSDASEREATTAEQGLITDRLNKATEGLGKTNQKDEPVIAVRLGALYALERIAQDSIRDHVSVMEILCAYVRQNSPRKTRKDDHEKLTQIREDIQAALTIIGRRGKWQNGKKHLKQEEQQNYSINLQNCDLHGASLNSTNFSKARFDNSDLTQTDISQSNLDYANFTDAMLFRTTFGEADIKYAKFVRTVARMVEFSGANMSCAQLDEIELDNSWFYSTIMDGAYAQKADFSKGLPFIESQLEQMYCGNRVILADDDKYPEHWTMKTTLDFQDKYKEWLEETYPDLAKNFK